MVENSSELNMIDQNHPNNSLVENTVNESPVVNMMSIVDVLYMGILDDLIDDCILDVCFEVHRAEKRAFSEKSSGMIAGVPSHPVSHPSLLSPTVQCFLCSRKISAEKLARHLSLCMGIDSKRRACQRIKSFKESEWETDSSDSDTRPSSSKKKSKRGNKNKSKHSRLQGNSSDSSSNYKEMTQEETVAFYNQHCGVISKRSKMPCKMTLNCSRHSEHERTSIRNDLLSDVTVNERDMNEQIAANDSDANDQNTSNEVIDVDGIDDDDESVQIT